MRSAFLTVEDDAAKVERESGNLVPWTAPLANRERKEPKALRVSARGEDQRSASAEVHWITTSTVVEVPAVSTTPATVPFSASLTASTS